MALLAADFIQRQKKGGEIRKSDIETFIQDYALGNLPDYQMAAWLMAVCFRPLNTEQTAWLTEAMANTGQRLKFQSPVGLSVDKHSTGGVGDKTSLILAPLVAAAGIHVPMMAGRGLGHTGGTLDKLETIPGMNVRLDLHQFQKQVESIGVSIIGQTAEICPADRKMYSLRDVTSTVDSLSLICASIMSKKIAEGCQALVLDVKFGSGAFMKTPEEAEALARALINIGRAAGLKVSALLTSMCEPLGRFVGNALEVQECLEILKNETPKRPGKSTEDTKVLSLELAAHMLSISGGTANLDDARKLAHSLIESGQAYEKFEELVAAQGGSLALLPLTFKEEDTLTAQRTGYLRFTDIEKMGFGCVVLGAGRKQVSDVIDPTAGLEVLVKNGDRVQTGDALLRIVGSDRQKIAEAKAFFEDCFEIAEQKPPFPPLIAKVLI